MAGKDLTAVTAKELDLPVVGSVGGGKGAGILGVGGHAKGCEGQGFGVELDELKTLRAGGSRRAGNPENGYEK